MKPIKPIDHNGNIQLKFTVASKRYSLNPIPGGEYNNPRDLSTAKAVAAKIQNDILAGCFNTSLDKYRLVPKAPKVPKVDPEIPIMLITLWDLWVKSLDISEATKAHHYKAIRNQILKHNPEVLDTQWFTQADLAGSTFNQRLEYLTNCYRWALNNSLVLSNPYAAIKHRKITKQQIRPFNPDEVRRILESFSTYYAHYLPFVKFLFITGVRSSEAIGLRRGHLDFTRGAVTIRESLSRDWEGNGYQRIRKDTKSGNERVIGMSEVLRQLLIPYAHLTDLDALVFTTIRGHQIDDGNFRERYWVKALLRANVPYRKPYTTRHTMISQGIEQGIPLTGLAYLAGHSDTRMVMETYGHMINKPNLPDVIT